MDQVCPAAVAELHFPLTKVNTTHVDDLQEPLSNNFTRGLVIKAPPFLKYIVHIAHP